MVSNQCQRNGFNLKYFLRYTDADLSHYLIETDNKYFDNKSMYL